MRLWFDARQSATVLRPANGLMATTTLSLNDTFQQAELRNLRCEVQGAEIDGPVEIVANGVRIMTLDEFRLRFDANDKALHADLLHKLQVRVRVQFAPHGIFSSSPMQATVTICARCSKPPDRATCGAVEQPLQFAVYENGIVKFR